jgi:hypothetical protein
MLVFPAAAAVVGKHVLLASMLCNFATSNCLLFVLICASGALEDGIRCGERALPSLASYESNVLYALRFMVDTNMGGGQWLEIPAGTV